MSINEFRGDNDFLSNFYPAKVELDDVQYRTVEHAFQAAKTLDHNDREEIRQARTAAIAKWLGRRVDRRPEWEDTKVEVMYGLLKQKFAEGALLHALIATGDQDLVEGNWWNDTFWGVCKGVGENHLGKLLMRVREEAHGQPV